MNNAERLFYEQEASDLTEDEFALFLERCKRRGMDPVLRLVIPQVRVDRDGERRVIDMTTIDAYRSIAEKTGQYRGQTDPVWRNEELPWQDHWPKRLGHPEAALVKIRREGWEPVGQPAHWDEYAQTKRGGELVRSWAQMGALLLAKCSEALGFRKTFPEPLSGTYTYEEMMQTGNLPGGVTEKGSAADLQAEKVKEAELALAEPLKDWKGWLDDSRGFVKKYPDPKSSKREEGSFKFWQAVEKLWLEHGAAIGEIWWIVQDPRANQVVTRLLERVYGSARWLEGNKGLMKAKDYCRGQLNLRQPSEEDSAIDAQNKAEEAEPKGPSNEEPKPETEAEIGPNVIDPDTGEEIDLSTGEVTDGPSGELEPPDDEQPPLDQLEGEG